ncbi:hypothetical protein N9811_07295 [Bacteroidia bacterium]|nr:hypothetical protein [Bacteroidia bacterium]
MLGAVLPGCTDKEEPIPSYLYIPRIDLQVADDGTQGSNAHDIRDAWVYVNGSLIGAFEMPATIPILESGVSTINVFAGIKKNGLTQDRIRYPMFRSFDTEMELTPGVVDTLIPVVVYNQSVKFSWIEDFEDRTISLEKSGGDDTSVDSLYVIDNEQDVYAYDGTSNKYSGRVDIPSGFQIFENRTIGQYELPRSGQDIYLELNFKCNTEFVVGMYPLSGNIINGYSVVNLFSTADADGVLQWKKVYVSLSEDVNNPQYNGLPFKPFFAAQTNKDENSVLFFDNIKLVHF